MASWVGAATLLSGLKDRWRGTLVFIGQPAEEMVSGANAMVKDGLFTRFPKPDFVLGLHDTSPRRRVRLDALRVGAGREARAGLDRDTHAA